MRAFLIWFLGSRMFFGPEIYLSFFWVNTCFLDSAGVHACFLVSSWVHACFLECCCKDGAQEQAWGQLRPEACRGWGSPPLSNSIHMYAYSYACIHTMSEDLRHVEVVLFHLAGVAFLVAPFWPPWQTWLVLLRWRPFFLNFGQVGMWHYL